jgi:hypothetical protein
MGISRQRNGVRIYDRQHRSVWFMQQVLLFSVLFFSAVSVVAQTTMYRQFSPEFQLNRALSDKWAAELDLNGTFSNTPTESKVFKTLTQGAGLLWGHYYFSPRWKFSSCLAFYNNHDQPDIGQYESKEWRVSLMGTYYIHKIGFTLTTKPRVDIRFIQNEEAVYQDVYRYRQQLKFVKPINSQVLRQGVVYAIASDEIFFKSTYKSTGFHYFDRNMLVFGAGYVITANLQVEFTYTNEFAPRDNGDQLYNLFSFTFITNNLFSNIGHKIVKMIAPVDETE